MTQLGHLSNITKEKKHARKPLANKRMHIHFFYDRLPSLFVFFNDCRRLANDLCGAAESEGAKPCPNHDPGEIEMPRPFESFSLSVLLLSA
jgi:hypothetical protein